MTHYKDVLTNKKRVLRTPLSCYRNDIGPGHELLSMVVELLYQRVVQLRLLRTCSVKKLVSMLG